MEKGIDFDDSFSPTPGLAVGRFMLSLAVANDYELHACDIEQAFLQADKLPEGVNGRYFIQPPPGSPDADNKDVVYEVCRPLYGSPSSPRALHKTLDAYFLSEGFNHVGFKKLSICELYCEALISIKLEPQRYGRTTPLVL